MQKVAAAPDKNVFFSPFSVTMALTMALNGADAKAHERDAWAYVFYD